MILIIAGYIGGQAQKSRRKSFVLSVFKEYQVRGIPNLILIDKNGIVRYNKYDPAKLKEVLKKLAGR